MTDAQWESLEKRIERTELDLRKRLDEFASHVDSMTNAMMDVRAALLGDLKNTENAGLIAGQRQLRAELASFKADMLRWRMEAAEPAIKDVFKFKIQVGVISAIIVVAWTVFVKLFWK